ncbi:hypothetical protein LC612_30500 [Nostoc sp. CHAB 5834]|nr:hypothetical protein [Nostoc sp. CHAB 5834]
MKKYITTFRGLAEVTIRMEVTAEGQEAGLVAAHDQVLTVDPASVKVLSLVQDSLQNISFQEDKSVPLADLPQIAIERSYVVAYYADRDCKERLHHSLETGSLEVLRNRLRAKMQDKQLSVYASANVLDERGQELFRVLSPRGDMEVQLIRERNSEPEIVQSWISNYSEAAQLAAAVAQKHHAGSVKIMDLTNRTQPPVLRREIG